MTITYVGSKHQATGGTTNTITYSNAASGNWLIATGFIQAVAALQLSGITDSGSNTWQFSTSPAQSPPNVTWLDSVIGENIVAYTAWTVANNNVTSIVVTASGSAALLDTAIIEFSGISAAGTGSAVTATGASSQYPATAVTPATVNDLLIGFCTSRSGGGAAPSSIPPGSTKFPSPGSNLYVYDFPASTASTQLIWGGANGDVFGATVMPFTAPSADATPPIQILGAF